MDGTLADSSALDEATFSDAVRQTFGFRAISENWSRYRHVTAAGVLQEIVETHLGRLPTPGEIVRVQTRLEASLRAGVEEAGGVHPIPGAGQMLARLSDPSGEHALGLATGNWATIAQTILGLAGLEVDGVPAAYSDDATAREDICRVAWQRAEERHGCTFAGMVYVGDGVWDVRAVESLGCGFVGIGRGPAAERLREAGAAEVLTDYLDAEAFLSAVNRAARLPPASSRSAGTAASAR